MTPTDTDAYNLAADIIRHGEWAQDAWATDGHGRRCDPRDERAAAWSLDGAITAAAATLDMRHATDRLVRQAVLHVYPDAAPATRGLLREWNDHWRTTVDDVLATLAELAAATCTQSKAAA